MAFPVRQIGRCSTLGTSTREALVAEAAAAAERFLSLNPSRRQATEIVIQYSRSWRAYTARAQYRSSQGTSRIGTVLADK